MSTVRALINGEPARSFAEVRPGAELSFDGELRAGDVVLFGEERYRATRDASGGVAFERISCTACGSPRVVPIVYGEPPPELGERAKRGELVLGGCMLSRESPAWACRDCTREFGRLDEEHPEMFKERSDG